MKPRKISISVGVMAHNEGKNIDRLLDDLLAQKLNQVSLAEVVVVSSGSVDETNRVVNLVASHDRRVRLVIQKERLGKASAVNLFLARAKEKVLVLLGADLGLEETTLENLVTPFRKPEVGIVGAHPVPVNDPKTFLGFAGHLIWEIHHQISLKTPKMGEMVAFRKIFQKIPADSAVDEANIEALVRGQGYQVVYQSQAIVHNRSPETIKELIARRRHIFAGHLITRRRYGYQVATLGWLRLLLILLGFSQKSWRFFLWTPLIVSLEIWSRFLGYLDYQFGLRNHTIWEITPSTKELTS